MKSVLLITALLLYVQLAAQTAHADVGPITGLPMPRFVSLKASEANVRRGPSKTHRIDWIFKRRDMPLRVIAEHGHWRRVEDPDGVGGWLHYSLISGVRTVIIDEDIVELRRKPVADAPVAAMLERGVVARLNECTIEWCLMRAGGYRGWAPKSSFWGVDRKEIID
jgi:SH3-like domain-containing protein